MDFTYYLCAVHDFMTAIISSYFLAPSAVFFHFLKAQISSSTPFSRPRVRCALLFDWKRLFLFFFFVLVLLKVLIDMETATMVASALSIKSTDNCHAAARHSYQALQHPLNPHKLPSEAQSLVLDCHDKMEVD